VDLITLATAVVPNRDEQLANFFKVAANADGFFVEKHAKLGPSEFATDGVFLCGLAHYPKPIDEAIAQGQAAAARAVTLLSRKKIFTSGTVADGRPALCSQCGVCVRSAPTQRPPGPKRGRLPAGPRSTRAVQGLRAVRGLLPLRGHPPEGLRQRPDLRPDIQPERSCVKETRRHE
jgi:heterodisulfide reductase subunit A2